MRHRVSGNNLRRKTSHRLAMLKNLATSLIQYKKIRTTLAKAKALRPYVEKVITKAKNDKSFSSVKSLKIRLGSDYAVKTLLTDLAPQYAPKQGGYTRIIKLPARPGDNALMARIELIDLRPIKKAAKITGDKTKKEVSA